MKNEEKIKCAQLDLLNEVDRICKENGIKYFLIGGTLIGSVRHNGFIPWDDDIDVGMLREEYDKFIELCKNELNEQYVLFDWNIDNGSPIPFLKLKIKGTQYVENNSKDVMSNNSIFIDIFPFDNVPQNKIKRKVQKTKLYYLKKIILIKCNYNINKRNFLEKVFYIFIFFISKLKKLEKWKKKYMYTMKQYNGKVTEYVANMSGSYSYDKETILKTVLNDLILHDFEVYKFYIPRKYDYYLRHVYGDYMKLPPEEERRGNHEIIKIDFGNYKVQSKLKNKITNERRINMNLKETRLDKNLVITSDILISLIGVYVFSIVMFDYTIVYKIAIGLLLLFDLILCHRKKITFTPLFKMNFILILYFFIHTLLGFSVNQEFSNLFLETMIMNLVILFVVERQIDEKNTIEELMRFVIYSSLITCIYVFVADRKNILSGHLGANICKPFFNLEYSHNDIPMVAAYSSMFLSYFSVEKRRIRFSKIMQLFFSMFVILSGARKSLILIVFSIFIFPFIFSFKEKNYKVKFLKIMICFFCIIIAFIIIMKNSVLYNIIGYRFEGVINGIKGDEYTESSAISRSVMLETALNLFKKNPFKGYGLNTFRTFNGSFGTWSHNNFLELAVSGGILAPIIYYSFLISSFFRLLKLKKDPMNGMFISIIFFMIIHDFLSVSYISRMVMFIFCLLDKYIIISTKNEEK